MRRLLPVIFCVAAATGLAACDQETVSEPSPDEQEILYDAVRAAHLPPPAAYADGDVALSRPAGGGGQDIVVFDIVDSFARNSNGAVIQVVSDSAVSSPEGEVLCTKGSSGGFTQLRDGDGDVVLSTVGPLVFEGQPNLAGKNIIQQAIELLSHLRFSYSASAVMEGIAASGDELVTADVPIQYSSSWRKLVIAALVDGYCGSDGLPE